MKSSLHYAITPSNLHAHLFQVNLTIENPDPGGVTVYLPVWTPGSYLVREFARNIYRITAQTVGRQLEIQKLDKHRWRVEAAEGPILIEYEVYAFDLSVRGAYLDQHRAYFNGNVVFLGVDGREHEPVTVELHAPSGETDWRIATALPRSGAEPMGFGRYSAKDYDELIDCPVEMGAFDHRCFRARGITHHLVLSGQHGADIDRIASDLEKICTAQIDFFGDAPFNEYWFLTNVVGDGYGGLEHRSSTALLCARDDLLTTQEQERKYDYQTFLGLVSHEYFHAWNVKAIRPARFTPYNLHEENYTRLLWAFEGVTSYYDDLFLVRAGVMSWNDYFERLSHTMTGVRRAPGRLRQTLEDASFDAWIKYYRPDENASNALLSYYTQGALAGMAIDLAIRQGTGNKVSLDDVMRVLYDEFGKTGRGIDEEEWEAVALRVTGLDLKPLFDRVLRAYDDLPLKDLLPAFGIEMQWRYPTGLDDKGGWRDEIKPRIDIGARLEHDVLGVRLGSVLREGAAEAAGLAAGDIILAVNGLRVTRSSWERLLARQQIASAIEVHAFRRDELFNTRIECRSAEQNTAGLRLAAGEWPNRHTWLTGKVEEHVRD